MLTLKQILDKVFGPELAEIFELNQAMLPQEERTGLGLGKNLCGLECPDRSINPMGFVCTLPVGHSVEEHIAHGLTGNIEHRWK